MLGDPTKQNDLVVLTFEGVGKVVLPSSISDVATVAPVKSGWLVTGWAADGSSWQAISVDRRGEVNVLATAPWLSARPDPAGRRVGIFMGENPYSGQARSSRLEVVTLDTGQRKTFQAPGAFGRIVDWTGESVAVVARKEQPGAELRVLDMTTGSWQQIPVSGDAQLGYACDPSSSADRGLIQVRMPSGNFELRVVDDSQLVDAPIRVPRSPDPAAEPFVRISPDCRYVALSGDASARAPLAVTDLNNGAAVRFPGFAGDLDLYGASWESGTVLVGMVSRAVDDQALWVRWNLASGKVEQFTAPIGSGPGVPRASATAPTN